MRKYFFIQCSVLLVCATSFSQLKPDHALSTVKFHVRNFGIRTDGLFRSMNGIITFDVNHLSDAKFEMTVDAASIDTDNELRDGHLRGEGYFDVQAFPLISFVSRQVTATATPGTFNMTGELTIKGHSKTISFPFMYAIENNRIVFTGSFNMNRKDFDIGGTSVISDSVGVDINVVVEK